jgi:hypothetical protein
MSTYNLRKAIYKTIEDESSFLQSANVTVLRIATFDMTNSKFASEIFFEITMGSNIYNFSLEIESSGKYAVKGINFPADPRFEFKVLSGSVYLRTLNTLNAGSAFPIIKAIARKEIKYGVITNPVLVSSTLADAGGGTNWIAINTTSEENYFKNLKTSDNVIIGGTLSVAGTSSLTGNLTLSGDLAVNGGDITTSSSTLNIGNTATTAQTVNLGTASTASGLTKAVNLGTGGATGSTTNVAIGSSAGGTTTINSGTVVGALATQNLYNTIATTLNFGGAATALTIGATSGTTTIRNAITAISNALTVGTTLGVTGISTLTGLLNANGGIAVDTNKFTVSTAGAVLIASTLGVTGVGTFSNLLNANGGIAVDTNKFTVSTAGAVAIASTLAVTGVSTLTGLLNANGGIAVATDKFTMSATTGAGVINGELTVDNIKIDGTTISSTNTNGNITIAPNGSGQLLVDADTLRVGDLNAASTITTNGTGNLTIRTGSTNSGAILINQGNNGNIEVTPHGTGDVYLNADTLRVGDSGAAATITTNGTGGLTINTNAGTNSGSISIPTGINQDITISPNGTGKTIVGTDLQINGGDILDTNGNESVRFTTTTSAVNEITVANAATGGTPTISATGGDTNINLTLTAKGSGNVIVTNDLAVNGGDITTNQTTATVFNATATTVSAFNAATTLNLGSSAAVPSTTNIAIGAPTTGTKAINIGTGGASGSTTNITIGSGTSGAANSTIINGAVGINGGVVITDDLNVNGGDIVTTATSFDLLNTTATTVNAFGAATTVNIGATTGTATIKNANVVLDGDLAVNGGDITSSQESFNLLNSNIVNQASATTRTVNLSSGSVGNNVTKNLNISTGSTGTSAASNINIGVAAGTTNIKSNNVILDGDLAVNGSTSADITTTTTAATIFNANATSINAFGAATTIDIGSTANTAVINLNSTKEATSSTVGGVVIDGGLAIAKKAYVGTDLIVGGDVTVDGGDILQTAKTGTNIAGTSLAISSGAGTGTGTISTIAFRTPTLGTNGITEQALETRLVLNSSGAAVTGALSTSTSIASGTTLTAGSSLSVTTTSSLGGNVTFTNGADRTFSIASTAAGTAGRILNILSGSTTAGTANIAGGNLNIRSGQSTGSGTSSIAFQTPNTGTAGATTLNDLANRLVLDSSGAAITGNTTITGDLAVNGGDVTTSSGTFTIGNTATTAQTLNLGTATTGTGVTKAVNLGTGGAAGSTTNIAIGSSAGGTTTIASPTTSLSGVLNVTGNTTLTGDLVVNGGDLTTTTNTFYLLSKPLTLDAGAEFDLEYNINIGTGTDTDNSGNDRKINRIITLGNENSSVVVPGNLTISGDITVTDTAQYSNILIKSDNASFAMRKANDDSLLSVDNSGNTAINGTLTVTKETNLNGGLKLNTNKFTVAEATGNTAIAGTLQVTDATPSTSSATGALIVTGGVGIGEKLYVGGNIYENGVRVVTSISGDSSSITDPAPAALVDIQYDNGNLIKSYDSYVHLGNATAGQNFAQTVHGIKTFANNIKADGGITVDTNKFTVSATGAVGVASTLGVAGITSVTNNTSSTATNNGALIVTGGVGIGENLNVGGDIAVNGGDITSTSENFNLINGNIANKGSATNIAVNISSGTIGNNVAKTINIGTGNISATAASQIINIGSSSSVDKTTLNLYGNLNVSGTVTAVSSNEVNLGDSTLTLNSDITTSAGNADGGIQVKRLHTDNIGRRDAELLWDEANKYWEAGYQGTLSEIATQSKKLDFFTATTSAELATVISDETGTGKLVFATSPDILTSLTTSSTSFDLLNTTATTINLGGAATALTIGATTGTATIRNASTSLTGTLTVGSTSTLGGNVSFTNAANREIGIAALTTTDTAGRSLSVNSGLGNGASVSSISFKTPTAAAAGINQTVLADRLVLNATGATVTGALSASTSITSGTTLTVGTTSSLGGNVRFTNGADRAIDIAAVTGTNSVGRTLTLASGQGTGTGAVSSISFQTPTLGTTGTDAQSLATRLLLNATGATVTGALSTSTSLTVGTTSSLGGDVTFTNGADRTFNIASTAAGTAGRALSILSGSTTAGTANTAGGNLNIRSGQSTGSGTSSIVFQTPNSGTAGATTLNSLANRLTLDSSGAAVTGVLTVSGNTTLTGDLAVNGGDITTSSGIFTIGNTAATNQTLNLGTAATGNLATKEINLGTGGATGSTTNINIGSSIAGTTTINSLTTSVANALSVGTTSSLGGNVTFTNGANRVIDIAALTTNNTAGRSLSINSGLGNGVNVSSISFKTPTSALAGTNQSALLDRLVLNETGATVTGALSASTSITSGTTLTVGSTSSLGGDVTFTNGADRSIGIAPLTTGIGRSLRIYSGLGNGDDSSTITFSLPIQAEPGENQDSFKDVLTLHSTAILADSTIQHKGLTMTSGTNVDQLFTKTVALALSTSWVSSTISGTDLATGTYAVQVESNGEFFSGTMSWFSGATTSTTSEEILLHRAGASGTAANVYLRASRRGTVGAPSTMLLEIAGNVSSVSSNRIFKFRRLM